MRPPRCARTCWHLIGLTGLGLLLLFGTACAGVGSIQGQVFDAQTKQPIPGAIVLGVWTQREGMVFHITKLVDVKEVEVDAQGRFTLDRSLGFGIEESITVYKFGYVAWSNELIFPSYENRKSKGIPDPILLELFPAGESHHKHAMFINSVAATGMYGIEGRAKLEKELDREYRMP
jgi:hypothetical protein